jgi:hypothetical protein
MGKRAPPSIARDAQGRAAYRRVTRRPVMVNLSRGRPTDQGCAPARPRGILRLKGSLAGDFPTTAAVGLEFAGSIFAKSGSFDHRHSMLLVRFHDISWSVMIIKIRKEIRLCHGKNSPPKWILTSSRTSADSRRTKVPNPVPGRRGAFRPG